MNIVSTTAKTAAAFSPQQQSAAETDDVMSDEEQDDDVSNEQPIRCSQLELNNLKSTFLNFQCPLDDNPNCLSLYRGTFLLAAEVWVT